MKNRVMQNKPSICTYTSRTHENEYGPHECPTCSVPSLWWCSRQPAFDLEDRYNRVSLDGTVSTGKRSLSSMATTSGGEQSMSKVSLPSFGGVSGMVKGDLAGKRSFLLSTFSKPTDGGRAICTWDPGDGIVVRTYRSPQLLDDAHWERRSLLRFSERSLSPAAGRHGDA